MSLTDCSGLVNGRPAALPVIPESIPPELKALAQWVVWQYVEDVDPETGEADWDKPPLCARGGPASSTNPATWAAFGEALAAMLARQLDGLGLALHAPEGHCGERLVAIDLDHCRDRETGVVLEWAYQVTLQLNSY